MRPVREVERLLRPRSLAEALELLDDLRGGATIIAGGTGLLPLRQGGATGIGGGSLVDLSLLGLDGVERGEGEIIIGATTTLDSLISSPVLSPPPYHVLADAARSHSTRTIRNRATVGGNLCDASPCGDLAPALLVLDAAVAVKSARGSRTVALTDFFAGPNCTVLEPGELLAEVRIPTTGRDRRAGFVKLRRHQTAIDMAVVNAAASVSVEDGVVTSARVAVGCVGPTPLRARRAEAALEGGALEAALLSTAARCAADESSPLDDVRASAAYRREMVPVVVRRALELAREGPSS